MERLRTLFMPTQRWIQARRVNFPTLILSVSTMVLVFSKQLWTVLSLAIIAHWVLFLYTFLLQKTYDSSGTHFIEETCLMTLANSLLPRSSLHSPEYSYKWLVNWHYSSNFEGSWVTRDNRLKFSWSPFFYKHADQKENRKESSR
jgi:hypothetical protein